MKLFIIAALLFFAASAVNVKCKQQIYDPTKQRYYEFDLSSLHHDESCYVDTLWYRTDDNSIYYVNFCGQTASACASSDTSVCIRRPDGADYRYDSGGSTTTQQISIAEAPGQTPATSVTVTYSKGEKCGNGYFTTKIYVNCMQTANPGYFYNVDESKECEATMYMWAAAGCAKDLPGPPTSSSSSEPPPVSSSSASDECGAVIKDDVNKRAYKFDLSALHHDDWSPVDTLWYRTQNNVIYYMNFCGQSAAGCSKDSSVCIRRPDGARYDYVSGGRTNTQQISIAEAPGQSPSSSVTVTYSNGDQCLSGGEYKTKVYVNCMPTANPGYFYKIDEPNDCEATLYMWSASGCGTEVPYTEA